MDVPTDRGRSYKLARDEEVAAGLGRRLAEPATVELKAAIGHRQEQLAGEALPLGRRLYAERPEDFTCRLRRYWEAFEEGEADS